MNVQKLEIIAFVITLASFCGSVLYNIWRISASVATMRHGLEKQDLRLEHLVDSHALTFNGLRERNEHSISRLKGEIEDLSDRQEDVENFLQKNTAFEKR